MLRRPKWAEGLLPPPGGSAESAEEASPVGELVLHLANQRLYREVSFTLKQAMRDAKAEFPFIRTKGLKALIRFLNFAAKSEKVTQLFNESQNYRELQGSVRLHLLVCAHFLIIFTRVLLLLNGLVASISRSGMLP